MAVIWSARPMMPSAFPVSAIISRLARSSEIAARLISTLTRAVDAAARAHSAAAATSLITLLVADHDQRLREVDHHPGQADDLGRGPGRVGEGLGDGRGPGGLLLARGPGQPVGVGHRQERVRVRVGQPQRDVPQLIHLGDDPADRHLMLGVLLAGGVPGHHAEQRRALGGEQRRGGAAARGGDPLGELVQELTDGLVADGHVSSGSGGGRGAARDDLPTQPGAGPGVT